MKPWLVWTTGIALVGAAWAVLLVTPDDDAGTEPFTVSAVVGERAESRGFEAIVTDARRGARAEAGGWAADGTWVVVDLEIAAVGSENGAVLRTAQLVVDGVTYRASERPESLLDSDLAVGLARSGSLAFELPADAVSAPATLQLALADDTRLDDVVELPVDLPTLPSAPTVELLPNDWATS